MPARSPPGGLLNQLDTIPGRIFREADDYSRVAEGLRLARSLRPFAITLELAINRVR